MDRRLTVRRNDQDWTEDAEEDGYAHVSEYYTPQTQLFHEFHRPTALPRCHRQRQGKKTGVGRGRAVPDAGSHSYEVYPVGSQGAREILGRYTYVDFFAIAEKINLPTSLIK